MADTYGEETSTLDSGEAGDQISAILRRCRGRPRLTDTDRAKRRLESRKKYDVRRVYLGESHKVWSELRRRTSLSDAGLAEYLILLHSTYGERYQHKYGGKKPAPELCIKQKREKREEVTSLRSLVQWYQDHTQSCLHEPQLQALEPALGLSTSALWQCQAGHSFLQRFSSPLGGTSESETEGEAEGSGGVLAQTTRGDSDVALNHVAKATAPKPLPGSPMGRRAPPTELPVGDQAIWEMEVVMEAEKGPESQESENEGSCSGAPSGNNNMEDSEEQVGAGQDRARGGATGQEGGGYECVLVTASVTDGRLGKSGDTSTALRNHVANGNSQAHPQPIPAPPTALPLPLTPTQVTGQGELFEPQTLQTVVASCQIPDGRGALEGSQVIIITGPSYEALASEGIQLNMGGGAGDEVTCTFIEGVAYNQVCQPEASLKAPVPDTESIRDLGNKQLVQPSVGPLRPEASADREHQRSLSRSRRSRRGPVIEADGMLKMFHCPYEGCVRDFICETCGKSFKRKNHLEVHRRTHTGETPLQCEICGYQCRQRASLNWHMKKHTPEAQYNFTCEHCGKRFEKLDSVKFHKLKSHPDKQAT
ncbi:hypothetical protein JZ751_013326 [Albula glossodonta]|uniref:C2H2-type domain-containing protein n=1 Tax=Albula glossodonta TaxID=121402 RepID=A0A8T2P2U2_9TELE|nr:hypothetical protein JZ751_013326 [Albula glossodonta]